MTTMNRGLQTFFAYKFIKLLVRDFEEWEAFKLGLIDENGKRTDKRADSTNEKQQVGVFMNLTRKLKRLIRKLPGGRTTFGSIIAASVLLKEECFNHNIAFLDDDFTQLVIEELGHNADKINIECELIEEYNQPELLQEGIYTIDNQYVDVFGKPMFYIRESIQSDNLFQFPLFNLTDVHNREYCVIKEMLIKIK